MAPTPGDNESPDSLGRLSHIRLPTFSGEDKDTPFDNWKFDVQCYVKEGRSEVDILGAIRRSVKGAAARTLVNLGIEASVGAILSKFGEVYAPAVSAQTILQEFYSMRQRPQEDAGAFAARLEDCIFKAVRLEKVKRAEAPAMLLGAFQHGLCAGTKLATGHLFHAAKPEGFDALVTQVKLREGDVGPSGASANAVQAAPADLTKLSENLLALSAQVSQCVARLDAMHVGSTGAQDRQPVGGGRKGNKKKRGAGEAMANYGGSPGGHDVPPALSFYDSRRGDPSRAQAGWGYNPQQSTHNNRHQGPPGGTPRRRGRNFNNRGGFAPHGFASSYQNPPPQYGGFGPNNTTQQYGGYGSYYQNPPPQRGGFAPNHRAASPQQYGGFTPGYQAGYGGNGQGGVGGSAPAPQGGAVNQVYDLNGWGPGTEDTFQANQSW